MTHVETCPRCGLELVKVTEPVGYRCERCQGHAFAVGQLRRVVAPDALAALWQLARAGGTEAGGSCPSCRNPMVLVHAHGVDVDVCGTCQLVWFDAGETRRLPPRPAEPEPGPEPELELPEDVVVAMAMAEADRARQRAYRSIPSVPPGPAGP